MTSFGSRQQEKDQEDGAPEWMRTFGDSLTLLLTFFVLLLTFSTPGKEQLRSLGFGPLEGPAVGKPFPREGRGPFGGRRWRLIQSRPADSEGGQVPPLYGELAPAVEDSDSGADLSRIPEVKGSVRLDIPLDVLFGDGGSVTRKGERMLRKVHRVCRAGPARVIVRTVPLEGRSGEIARSLEVIECLRTQGATGHLQFDISTDAALAPPGPSPGTCRITILRT